MPGPAYQQFQGYPNPVGNYFAGQDAGYGRAKENFNDQQTLETQNALVQQSGAQSYPGFQAQQMQAKQMLDMYGPALQSAVENENYAMRDAVAETLRKTGNPLLGQFVDVAATAKKLDKGAYGYDITFTTPEQRSATYKSDKYLQSVYPNEDLIQLNMPYRVSVQGMPGTPGSHTTKFEAVSRTTGKSQTQSIDVKDPAQLDELDAQYEDNPEALAAIDQARTLLKSSPGGVTVSLPGLTKMGAKAIKTPYMKPQQDSVSTLEGLNAAVAGASPAVATKILAEAVPAIKKGFIVTLARDAKGALTGSIVSEKRPPTGGAGGVGVMELTPKARQMLAIAAEKGITVPLPSRLNVNEKTKVLNEMASRLPDSDAALQDAVSVAGLNQASRKATTMELTKLKSQRGQIMSFARSAELGFKRAVDLVDMVPDSSIPLLNKALRAGAKSLVGDTATTNLYAQLHFASNEFSKVTTSATGAGSQGSQKDRDAIAAIFSSGSTKAQIKSLLVNVIEKDLAYRKQGYDEAIARGEASLRESSGTESMGGKGDYRSKVGKPSLDEYIKTMVGKFPQYKNKTRVEWQAVYDKKFSGGQ
jgi:hypothetical protein